MDTNLRAQIGLGRLLVGNWEERVPSLILTAEILRDFQMLGFQQFFHKGERKTGKGKGDRDRSRMGVGIKRGSRGEVFWFPFLSVSVGLTWISGANSVVIDFRAGAETGKTGY